MTAKYTEAPYEKTQTSTSPQWLDTSEINEAQMTDKDEAYYALAESQLRNKQVGGDHYKKHTIQPWDVIEAYGLDFWEGNALKYLLRQKGNRVEDLQKAIHYLEKVIERESK